MTDYYIENIRSLWNNFYLIINPLSYIHEYRVTISSNKLGLINLNEPRTRRLELMYSLQEHYDMNSVEISDFMNSYGIRTPRNKSYNPKIVWVSLKKYRARLDRHNNDKIIDTQERILINNPIHS